MCLNLKSIFEFLSVALKSLPSLDEMNNYNDEIRLKNQIEYIRHIYDFLSDDEKEQYRQIIKGQDLEIFLDYLYGNVKKKDIPKIPALLPKAKINTKIHRLHKISK